MPFAEFEECLERFPTLPAVVTRVLEEIANPESTLEEIARIIALDPVIAGHCLRVTRSAMFGCPPVDDSIERSIIRLGCAKTKEIVTTVGVMQVLPKLPQPLDLTSFWVMSLATGMTAKNLAKAIGYDQPDAAYLCGLVHMIGDAFLAINHTDRYRSAVKCAQETDVSYEQALDSEFGLSPAWLSSEIATRWGFPEKIVTGARYSMDRAGDPCGDLLASIVFAADRICRDLELSPKDPAHKDSVWYTEIPPQITDQILAAGYPDFSFYIMEQKEGHREIREFVLSTFGASAS